MFDAYASQNIACEINVEGSKPMVADIPVFVNGNTSMNNEVFNKQWIKQREEIDVY